MDVCNLKKRCENESNILRVATRMAPVYATNDGSGLVVVRGFCNNAVLQRGFDCPTKECVGSSLKEMNQMTPDPLFTKKKDAPHLAVPRKKKKTYAQSSIDKRVNWIIRESKGLTEEGDLIDKEVLKKYLLETEESEGFYCSVSTGIIDNYGMPNIYPIRKFLDDHYRYPEKYAEYLFLATLAVAKYNQDHDIYFKVVEIEHLNVSVLKNFITFSAVEVKSANKGLFLRFFIRTPLSCSHSIAG